MIYTYNLQEIIFNRHQHFKSDEFIIVSGYVGPDPVSRLEYLPFHTKLIYGMYGSEGIKTVLHNSLLKLNSKIDKLQIFYSEIPIHSKCYVWKHKGEIVHALIGSANFSTNGLNTPFREVLAETTTDSFYPLNEYLLKILNNSIDCREGAAKAVNPSSPQDPDFCLMTLLDPKTGEVQNTNGLNWGQNPNNNTNPNDANIPIRADYIRGYPNLFPPKLLFPSQSKDGGKSQRHNDKIEIVWDDGMIMEGLLEGNYEIHDVLYPKQISSFPEKRILGEYIRNRIGVPSGARINRIHLEKYGRTNIRVSLLGDGVYYFDFSK